MPLYVTLGSDSVSGPYSRRGSHPPPHRRRPRVLAKPTHNHATGFPWPTCRDSVFGRPLTHDPASRRRFDNNVSVMLHTGRSCNSLVNCAVGYVFPRRLRITRRAPIWGGVRIFKSIMKRVYWWHTRRRGLREWLESGDKLTFDRGFCTF